MTVLDLLAKCECGCVKGEHVSNARGGFTLREIRYGKCRSCECREFVEAELAPEQAA